MSKIISVHPKINLLSLVATHILEHNHLDDAFIVFTHKRAVSFFQYYISKKIDKPYFLPHVYCLEDWVKEFYMSCDTNIPTLIGDYDQAWLAYESAMEVFDELNEDLFSWDDFFPWAIRIVKLFKEIDLELVKGKDIFTPPVENITEPAIKILEKMGKIYEKFNKKLRDRNVITYPKMLRFLAENEINIPNAPFYFVGFYALTKAEDSLLKKIFDSRDTYIYWHADIKDLPILYTRWKDSWGVKPESIFPKQAEDTDIDFFEAHSLHAELQQIKCSLPQKIRDHRPDKVAIVLISPESLIPLIYHLPDGPINITMGYPLKLTGISVLLDSLFELILGKDEKRGYSLNQFLCFLKSPYLKLYPNIEQKLVEFGAPYFRYDQINLIFKECSNEELDYLNSIFQNILFAVEWALTPYELCEALMGVFDFIKRSEDYGEFEQIFLDTLMESVFYPLENSFFANTKMQKKGLFNLMKNLLSTVSVPFEGEPLVGVQVMGILETRLLNFDEVFIFDVNEGTLPNVEEVNPLLPHQIRAVLELPDREKEEVITRYHFERLINSAKKVHLLWQFQTNSGKKDSIDSVKVKSRYVEKLLWEIEKKEKKIFSDTTDFDKIKKSSFDILIKNGTFFSFKYLNKKYLPINYIKDALKIISPTLIEQYIRCPLEFFYSRILKLHTTEKISEIKYNELGTALHKTMERFYKEMIEDTNIITRDDVKKNKERLFIIFDEEIKKQPFYRIMSDERRFILVKSVKYRLSKYIENHPVKTEIIYLEKEIEKRFQVEDIGYIYLYGKIDRIDLRDHIYRILDYKTGYIENIDITQAFDFYVEKYEKDNIFDNGALKEIVECLPDIQLPFYAYLFANYMEDKKKNDIWSNTVGAYITLRDKCQENYFITLSKDTITPEYGDWLRNDFIKIIHYVIRHIFFSEYWYPATTEGVCNYCDYVKMCKWAC